MKIAENSDWPMKQIKFSDPADSLWADYIFTNISMVGTETYLETYIPDLSTGMVVITDSSLWFRNQSHPWTNGTTKRNVSYLRSRFVIGLVPRKSFGRHVCRLVRNELTRVSTTVPQSCNGERRKILRNATAHGSIRWCRIRSAIALGIAKAITLTLNKTTVGCI